MSLCSSVILLFPNTPIPKLFFSFLPTPPPTLSLSLTPRTINLSSKRHSFLPLQNDDVFELEDELVIGDCVVFEEGVFDDPYLQNDIGEEPQTPKPNKKQQKPISEIEPENLVPEKWKEVQAEINITKKERRKIAQDLEFGSKVEKKKKGYEPIRDANAVKEYLEFKKEKLGQLNPLVLDNPTSFPEKEGEGEGEGEDEDERNGFQYSSERVKPKNPRWAVYGRGLEDLTEFFNGENYEPGENKSEGRPKMFTKEEKYTLNRKIPDVAAATCVKWLPLHTLAASGEFYFMNALLKHNVDINAVDKDGWTALHKAIIGKKQAITNYLLRESANPLVLDKDGATLMHYAVQTASSQAIKILLLYNVDINHQDNDGWTPLHLAVQARRTDVVRLLLIKGANKTLKNKDGLTPLELCLYSGQDTKTYELIKLLKKLPKQP
ncbi:hypothetical protein ACB092_02G247000 [Castanea dentata]